MNPVYAECLSAFQETSGPSVADVRCQITVCVEGAGVNVDIALGVDVSHMLSHVLRLNICGLGLSWPLFGVCVCVCFLISGIRSRLLQTCESLANPSCPIARQCLHVI